MNAPLLPCAEAQIQRLAPRAAADAAALAEAIDDIPVLTDFERSPEDAIIEISRRIEARLAEALPQLIESAVREYQAELADPPLQRRA